MAEYTSIIVAPHIDDAFFSLGGTLLANKGKPQKIVNVFATSDFTITGRKSMASVTRAREKEELLNAGIVKAEVEFWPFRAAGVKDEQEKVAARIKRRLLSCVRDADTVFFPLGIGGHGDHVFLAKMGLEFARKSKAGKIMFYEDLPYAVRGTKVFSLVKGLIRTNEARVFAAIDPRRSGMKPKYFRISLNAKMSLCKNYKTQVDWRILTATRAYGMMLGSRERVWRIAT